MRSSLTGRKFKNYFLIVPILFLCGIIIYFKSSLDRCYGFVDAFVHTCLLGLLSLVLFIYLVRQTYKVINGSINKKHWILTSFLVIVSYLFTFINGATYKKIRYGKSVLQATSYPEQFDIARIELFKDGMFYALYGHIDWSCSFTSYYSKKSDTLILNDETYNKSNGAFANRYIIVDSTLVPILDYKVDEKKVNSLKIIERELNLP